MDDSTFVDVVVLLNDGNQMLMTRCMKCDFVLQKRATNHHGKLCASKWYFKYIYRKRVRLGPLVKCLICNEEFTSPSVEKMKSHYDLQHKNSSEPTAIITSNQIEYVHEHSVSTLPANRRLHFCYTMGLSFKRVYVFVETKFKEFGECSVCKQLIDVKHQFVLHRRECPLPTEAISPSSSTIVEKKCFICKTKSSESFADLHDAMSITSKTPIYSLLYQIFNSENTHELINFASPQFHFLCAKCLDKINKYESFCMEAARLGDELRFKLLQTESLFDNNHRIRNSHEHRLIDDMSSETEHATREFDGIEPAEREECRTIMLSDDDEPDVILID